VCVVRRTPTKIHTKRGVPNRNTECDLICHNLVSGVRESSEHYLTALICDNRDKKRLVIVGFRQAVNEIFPLLRCYAT